MSDKILLLGALAKRALALKGLTFLSNLDFYNIKTKFALSKFYNPQIIYCLLVFQESVKP